MEEEEINSIFNYTPEQPDPEISVGETLAEQVRAKYPIPDISQGTEQQPVSAFSKPVLGLSEPKRPTVAFKEYVVDPDEIYAKVGDGYQAKFKNYITGTDNNERLALGQSTADKWANGLKKFGLQTGTAILGGTIGTVTGLFNAVQEGSLSAIYTDDFNQMLDEYNEKWQYTLPNYVAKEERNEGFFSSLNNANFWANDFLGGLSFTVGMIVSEGIWAAATGGSSLIAKGALGSVGRWSTKALGANKALRGVSKWKAPTKEVIRKATNIDANDIMKALPEGNIAKSSDEFVSGISKSAKRATILGARFPRALNQARFIYTSAGYEAGVEARHFMKEAEDEFINNFEQENGRSPNAQELAEFKVSLEGTANSVFLTNMALVGSSNMAVFGKMLLGRSVKPAASNSKLKRELFGVGYDLEKGAATALKANTRQKVAGKAYSILKAPLTEGVWEEGGQSVTKNAAKDYILDAFDSDATQDNLGVIESIMDGFSETYGTKQGRKEVGLGMLIGIFGGGIATKGRFNDISQERRQVQSLVDFRNSYQPDKVLAAQMMTERMKANNRIIKANKKQEEAKINKDSTGEFLSEQQAVLASIERDFALQGRKEGIKDFEAYINSVKDSELAEGLGIEESEVKGWKEQKIIEYKNLSDRYAENESYVRAIIGDTPIAGVDNTEQIIKALTYNMTIGEQAKEFTTKIVEDIKMAIAGEFNFDEELTALNVDQILSDIPSKSVKKYMNLSKRYKNIEDQKSRIENQLQTAQYKNTENPEQRKKSLDKLQQKLIDLDTQLTELQENKEVAYRALGIQEDLITESDLDAQAERIEALKDKIKGYETSNPKLYATLDKLLNEYNKAKSNTVSFNKVTKELLDPKIRVNLLNGWLGSLINKGKTLDESTAEFFKSQIDQYQSNVVRDKAFSDEALDKTQTDQPEEEETTSEEGDEMIDPDTETTEEEVSIIDRLKQNIEDIMQKSIYTTSYIGDNYDEAVKTKPSQEDLDRYEELLGKVNSNFISNYDNLMDAPDNYFKKNKIETGLTTEELNELKELQTKLSNWRVLEGSANANSSIADMLLIIEQLESDVEKSNTKKEITPTEYERMRKSPDTEVSSNFETASPVQTPGQVVVKLVEENKKLFYNLSHIEVTSLPRLFPDSTLQIVQNKVTKNLDSISGTKLKELSKKEGQEFILTTSEGEAIKITIGESSRLKINKEDFDSSIKSSNIAIVKYGSGNFFDIYERLSNGDLIPVKGDFNYESVLVNEIIEINPRVVNNIAEGDILITRINKNDSYNNSLLKTYNRKKKPTDEDFNELMNNLHIYVTDQEGQVVGSLKAAKSSLPDNSATKNLLELRRKAINMVLDENNTDDYFNLNEAIPVRTVLIGSPNFVIREEEGTLKPQPIDFTDTAIENIEDVGYLEGETLNLRNMDSDKVIKTFLPKNPTSKVPVVILNVNGKNVAFPVSLKSEVVDKSQQVIDLESTSLSTLEKVSRINQILIENGLKPSDYIVAGNELVLDTNKVIEDLSEVQNFPNVVDWVNSSFKLETIQQDAQISIDLDNKPFNLSKVILDLDKVRSIGLEEQVRTKYNSIENREIEVRSDLQSAVEVIESNKNLYPDVDDVRWTNVLFSEGELYKNPETDVERRHNINLMRDALYTKEGKKVNPPKAVREAYGEEFFTNLRNGIEELDEIIEQKRKMRSDLKNSKVKKETENQNTPC